MTFELLQNDLAALSAASANQNYTVYIYKHTVYIGLP